MKKRLVLIASLFLFLFSGPAFAEKQLTIGIAIPTADHGWTGGVVWWAEKAVKEFSEKYPDIKFILRTSDTDLAQTADVEFMLENNITGLVILPHRPAPLTTVLNKVHNSGAFIVVVDRSIPKVPKDVYLSGDNYGFGKECGLYMADALQGKGKILVMEGIPCEGNTLRVNGFKEGIKNTEIIVLDSQPAYWSPEKAYELMLIYLQQFPEVDAVWCGDDDVMVEALNAYRDSGRSDIRFFLGGGGSKTIIKEIIDGNSLIHATVTYPPNMVYEGIAITVERLVSGKTFDKEIVIPSELVTKENAKDFYYPDSIY